MNGVIIPHTPIAVDFWNVRKTTASNSRLFFLSHAHTDHTMGLTNSWKRHKIYTSEITKRIVAHKIGVKNELMVGLPVDKPVEIPMDEFGKEKLVVTLIDANHCPGAVMFLFEGYFGTILYTGDFRHHTSFIDHPVLKDKSIDKLYLDNTYCDPLCVFPSKSEAMAKVLDIIQDHLKRDFHVIIGLNTLGKEELLVDIGLKCQTWIGVNSKRLALLKLLELPEVFVCDSESTRIRVVMPRQITKNNLQIWNESHPTIAILPTALFEGDINVYQYMSNVFVIPLSDHSSYDELHQFVSKIKPKEIIPIVLKYKSNKQESSNSRANMNVFSSYLNKEPLASTIIPETVLKFMNYDVAKDRSNKRLHGKKSSLICKRRRCTGVVFHDEDEVTKEQSNTVSHQTEKEPPAIPDKCETDSMMAIVKAVQDTGSLHVNTDPIAESEKFKPLGHHEQHVKSKKCKIDSTVAIVKAQEKSAHVNRDPAAESERFKLDCLSGHQMKEQTPIVEAKPLQSGTSVPDHEEEKPTVTASSKRFTPLSFADKKVTVKLKESEFEEDYYKDNDQKPKRKHFKEIISLQTEEEQTHAAKRNEIQGTKRRRKRTKGSLDQYLCIMKNVDKSSEKNILLNSLKNEEFSNCNISVKMDDQFKSDASGDTNESASHSGAEILEKAKHNKDLTSQNCQNTCKLLPELQSNYYCQSSSQQKHQIREEFNSRRNTSLKFPWFSNSFDGASSSVVQRLTQIVHADPQGSCTNANNLISSCLQKPDVKQGGVTISSGSDDSSDSSSEFNWFTTLKFQ